MMLCLLMNSLFSFLFAQGKEIEGCPGNSYLRVVSHCWIEAVRSVSPFHRHLLVNVLSFCLNLLAQEAFH